VAVPEGQIRDYVKEAEKTMADKCGVIQVIKADGSKADVECAAEVVDIVAEWQQEHPGAPLTVAIEQTAEGQTLKFTGEAGIPSSLSARVKG
jgi:peptide subunit release factor 1 (eRF1)